MNCVFKNFAKIKSPCLNCSDRHIGCHSECDKYKEFTESRQSENEKISAERISDMQYKSYKVDVLTKENKKHNNSKHKRTIGKM